MEAQLRSVHRTMHAIEKLRGGEHHVGPELSNDERGTVLTGLADEVGVLEEELSAQEGCYHAMLDTVEKMQKRLEEARHRRTDTDSDEGPRQLPDSTLVSVLTLITPDLLTSCIHLLISHADATRLCRGDLLAGRTTETSPRRCASA